MTPADYYKLIRDCIKNAETEAALEHLEQLAAAYPYDNLSDFVTQTKARYQRAENDKNKGLIDWREWNMELNHINDAILSVVSNMEKEPPQMQGGRKGNKGRIVHNIPSRMALGVETHCSVRIAKNDSLLLEGFELPAGVQPEDVELSKIMEVEIIDPMGNRAFEVRRINRSAEQPIVDHTFTEWKFAVKPLLQGTYSLNLYVYIINKIDGEKFTRDISFEKKIDIVAYNRDFFLNNPINIWEATNIVVEDPRRGRLAGLGSGWGIAVALGSLSTLAVLGYLTYRLFFAPPTPMPAPIPKPITPKLVTPENITTLRINNDLRVIQVEMNGKPFKIWTANEDTSEIYVKNLPIGSLYVVVKGSNGNCSQLLTIMPTPKAFTLNCQVKKSPNKLQTTNYNVTLIAPFANLRPQIDGITQTPISTAVTANGTHHLVVSASAGSHNFALKDASGKYFCNNEQKNINKSGLSIKFNCNANNLPPPNNPPVEDKPSNNSSSSPSQTGMILLNFNNCAISLNDLLIKAGRKEVLFKPIENNKSVIKLQIGPLPYGYYMLRAMRKSSTEIIMAQNISLNSATETINHTCPTANNNNTNNNTNSYYNITVITPFASPSLTANGILQKPIKVNEKDASGAYKNVYSLAKNTYQLVAQSPDGSYTCQTLTRNIDKNLLVKFSCQIKPQEKPQEKPTKPSDNWSENSGSQPIPKPQYHDILVTTDENCLEWVKQYTVVIDGKKVASIPTDKGLKVPKVLEGKHQIEIKWETQNGTFTKWKEVMPINEQSKVIYLAC